MSLSNDKKKIGIFGGAFDPPHIGHVEVIRSVLHLGYVDEIWVVPAGQRAEKKMVTSAKDRFAMCVLVVQENFSNESLVVVRDDQIQSRDPSFSVDMLADFKNRYPNYDFWLVVGDDVVPDIPKWKEGEMLLREASFLIVERSGNIKEGVRLPQKYVILPRLIEMSSTLIRTLCEEEKNIALYVPKSVEEYIRKSRLYRKEKS